MGRKLLVASGFVNVSSTTSNLEQVARIKMSCRPDKAMRIKKVIFNVQNMTWASTAGNLLSLYLSRKTDKVASQLSSTAGVQEALRSIDVIAPISIRAPQAITYDGVMTPIQVEIPEPGFFVVNDMSFVAVLSDTVAIQCECTVYYDIVDLKEGDLQ